MSLINGKINMFTKILLGIGALFVVSAVIVTPVFASDGGHACKADADCGHGEHCKEGHCHK
jgi:hypothetical protein